MDPRVDTRTRDRALQLIRCATVGGAGAALGLSGLFAVVAARTFSGAPAAQPIEQPVPQVPLAATPVQTAPPSPTVIVNVIHSSAEGYSGTTAVSSGTTAPRAPAQAPAAAPAFPPAPVCLHSTPSHPC
ncbi:MAG: hypothetical protein ACYDAC_06930 [Candidatus Dormibacteria bacterium]